MVKGFEVFDKRLRISGVVLNKVSDEEHAQLLGSAMQKGGVKAVNLGWVSTVSIFTLEFFKDSRTTFLDGRWMKCARAKCHNNL